MRAIVDQTDLKRMLDHVAPAVDAKGDAGQASVLIEAGDNRLTVTAAAGGRVSRAWADVMVVEEGRALANHGWIRQIVSALPRTDVELESPDGARRLKLSAGPTRLTLALVDPDVWLEPPAGPDATIRAKAPDWARAVRQARASAAKGQADSAVDAKAALVAVHVTGDGDTLTLSSTDRFRFTHSRLGAPGADGLDVTVPAGLIPTPGGDDIRLGASDSQFAVASDDTYDAIPVLDILPADVTRIIGQAKGAEGVYLDRAGLSSAIARARVMASIGGGHGVLRVHLADGTVELTVDGADGAGRDRLAVAAPPEGPANTAGPVTFGADPAYLAGLLAVLDGPVIRLSWHLTARGGALYLTDPTDPSALLGMAPKRLL